MKTCKQCGTTDQDKFGKDARCKPCNNARVKLAYQKDPARFRKTALAYYWRNRDTAKQRHWIYEQKVKDDVFCHYGGYICSCCGDAHKAFLTIDHIDGGGTKHRKKTGGGGRFTYYWIRRNKYPKGFRVLCFNCNSGRALNKGVCPHEEEKRN